MQLLFLPIESALACWEATRTYFEANGKPVALDSKARIFRAARESAEFSRGSTQYERALYKLIPRSGGRTSARLRPAWIAPA